MHFADENDIVLVTVRIFFYRVRIGRCSTLADIRILNRPILVNTHSTLAAAVSKDSFIVRKSLTSLSIL